ncbi:molybdopterin-binding protein [Pelagibius sp. Alg239-R121]|uniref:competence/damage-inducible protein A n=1 Tax=Pelagibius sp. Alg239-R121 TaxID=2993448 RepID=UPI0024A719EF|nr:molybdopterin-binding protein [Pelagibius sp. Alg239-R121]
MSSNPSAPESLDSKENVTVTACLMIIGNEILSGRTKDANLGFLGEQLNEIGVRLMEVRVVPDIEAVIVETLNEVRQKFDYVFTTGGIGPTHDDITSACVAKAFGVAWSLHPEAHALLKAHYAEGELNEARLRMAHTPEGASLIENPISKAPGFQMDNVFVMAGIPRVMQAMFESLKPRLTGGAPVRSATLAVSLPEGKIAKGLGEAQDRFPDVEMGSYPYRNGDRFGVRLVLRSVDDTRLEGAVEDVAATVRALGDEPVRES